MKISKIIFGAAALALMSGCGPDQENDTGGDVRVQSAGRISDAVGLAAFTMAPADVSYGCQARSNLYPWGQGKLRIWSPKVGSVPERPDQTAGAPNSPPFQARLVQAYGDDYGEASRSVILETEDGCRRQFLTQFFSDEDNTYVQAEIDQHPATQDLATYRRVSDQSELLASGALNVYETQHFALWYGNGRDISSDDFARTMSWDGRSVEQGVKETAEWLEKVWVISRDIIKAPMPFADTQDKQKLNIFICGTGRPNVDGGDKGGCGAHAAETMGISGWAMKKGSRNIAHEFSHMIQWYAGNFRSNPGGGAFWETGANFNAYAASPNFIFYRDYLNQLEYGPVFSSSRYNAYPFMTYLYENDRTRPLVWQIWKAAPSNVNGQNDKPMDYIDQLVHTGQKEGVLPQGFVSFADDMGWYGARLVTMDFFNQRNMLDGMRPSPTTSSVGHFHVPLVASSYNATVFTPPTERSLLQWGTHIIPLTPSTPSGQRVTVTLTGLTTANQAAWRFALVIVKPGDVPVYSELGKAEGSGSGTTSLTIPADAKAYLAVTATPYEYESLGWQQEGKPAYGTTFPYSLRIEGATPWTAPVKTCDRDMGPGTWANNWNLNGNSGGWWPC